MREPLKPKLDHPESAFNALTRPNTPRDRRIGALELACDVNFSNPELARNVLDRGHLCRWLESVGDTALSTIRNHARVLAGPGQIRAIFPYRFLSNRHLEAQCLKLGIDSLIAPPHSVFSAHSRKGVLADSIECLVGAAYVDGGYQQAARASASLIGVKVIELFEQAATKPDPVSAERSIAEKILSLPIRDGLDRIQAIRHWVDLVDTGNISPERRGVLSLIGRDCLHLEILLQQGPQALQPGEPSAAQIVRRGLFLSPNFLASKDSANLMFQAIGCVFIAKGDYDARRLIQIF